MVFLLMPGWCLLRVMFASSICLLMATISVMVAHRLASMEPSPGDIVCRALGERLGTRAESRRRASLVSAEISPRKVSGGAVLPAGEGEAGSVTGGGVQDLLIAWARAWLPWGWGRFPSSDGGALILR